MLRRLDVRVAGEAEASQRRSSKRMNRTFGRASGAWATPGWLSRPRQPGATMAAMITISPARQFVMGSIIVNRTRLLTVAAALAMSLPVSIAGQQPPPPGKAGGVFPATQPDDMEGFVSIFDGKTLNGWDGDPSFWRVENGEIVGETTPEKVVNHNTFLIWRGGTVRDFELKSSSG